MSSLPAIDELKSSEHAPLSPSFERQMQEYERDKAKQQYALHKHIQARSSPSTSSNASSRTHSPKRSRSRSRSRSKERARRHGAKSFRSVDESSDNESEDFRVGASALTTATSTSIRSSSVGGMFSTAASSSAPVIPSQTDAAYDPSLFGCRKVACYKRLNTIDEGTYGVVHRATDIVTGELVALKKIKLDSNITASGFPITSLREINILLSLRHKHVVRLKEIVTSGGGRRGVPKGIYLVMEYAEHDVKELLNRMQPSLAADGKTTVPPQFQPFRVAEIKTLLKQLLEGMEYLHENWIIHRDLKTSNLLYNNEGQLKICDFGLARRYADPIGHYTPLVVTLWYRAPELLFGTKVYSTAVDIWSIGVIFAELLTQKPLFDAKTELEQIGRIIKVLGTPSLNDWPELEDMEMNKTFSFHKDVPNRLREAFPIHSVSSSQPVLNETGFHLLSQMLTYNPEKRITASEALQHPYFFEAPLPLSQELMPTFPSTNQRMHEEHASIMNSGELKRQKDQQQGGFYL